MAIEKTREFFKSIEAGGQAGEGYKDLLMECKGLSEQEAMDKVIRFASGKGFDISSEDIKAIGAEKQNRELTDEELNVVAGGTQVYWVFTGSGPSGATGFCVIIGVGM